MKMWIDDVSLKYVQELNRGILTHQRESIETLQNEHLVSMAKKFKEQQDMVTAALKKKETPQYQQTAEERKRALKAKADTAETGGVTTEDAPPKKKPRSNITSDEDKAEYAGGKSLFKCVAECVEKIGRADWNGNTGVSPCVHYFTAGKTCQHGKTCRFHHVGTEVV